MMTYVIIENIEAGKCIDDNVFSSRNKINMQHGIIFLELNGDYFKFIDVPGDGDYFFHSVLKYYNSSEKFNSVQGLRIYLKDMVNNWIHNDLVLQYLFTYKKIDYVW